MLNRTYEIKETKAFLYALVWGIYLTVLLFLPELFGVVAHDRFCYLTSHLFSTLSFDLTIVLLLLGIGLFLERLHSLIKISYIIVVHILGYSFSIVDTYLIKVFNTHINATVLMLLNETNSSEIQGFVSTYLLDTQSTKLIIMYLLILSSELLLLYWVRHKEDSFRSFFSTFIKYLGITIVVSFFFNTIHSNLRYFTVNYIDNYRLAQSNDIKNNSAWNLWQAAVQFKDNQASLLVCAEYQKDISIDSCEFKSDNIILIIGESFNRHHSSLYGYPVSTNPQLEKEDLFIFKDVITSYNITSEAFKNFLSLSSLDDSLNWYESPLLPAIMRQSGYNVCFYSNQYIKEVNTSIHNAAVGFFSHPDIEPYLFNYRNTEKFQYDGELVDSYKQQREFIEKDHHNFIIFHLRGQHFDPAFTYPSSFNVFSSANYKRPDLNVKQIQQIASYDNSTLYNDYVVSEIIKMYKNRDAIIIYFADHGDEANDYRPFVGRSFDFVSLGAPCLKAQLDIPFVIYATEEYKKHHRVIIEEIKQSVNNPFETDDLPHLLLYLAGIHSKFYDPSRNIISKSFNSKRRRIVDKCFIDYDEICK